MISEPESYHLLSIRACNIQAVCLSILDPENLLLQANNDLDCLAESGGHLLYWILLFPGLRSSTVCQASYVQRSQMLRVRASMNVLERIFSNDLQYFSLDVNKAGYHAIVHYGMASEDEGMIVCLCDWRGSRSSDVTKSCGSGCIGADAVEIVVVGRRFSMFVHSWSTALCLVKVLSAFSVPDEAEAVHVIEAVPNGDLIFCSVAVGSVRHQFWQVMFIDLLG